MLKLSVGQGLAQYAEQLSNPSKYTRTCGSAFLQNVLSLYNLIELTYGTAFAEDDKTG